MCEAPRPQGEASRKGNFILIVPLDPAYKAGLAGHLPVMKDTRSSYNRNGRNSPFSGRTNAKSPRRHRMRYRKIFLGGLVLFFCLASLCRAEDYSLQYFLSKASSKSVELSKREKMELFNQLDELIRQAQGIRTKLVETLQVGETDVRYQEGKFWMARLERDQGSIESGFQQIKLLREKPTSLIASIKLYKSLKDLSSNFNAYNNLPSFSALVGDFAPELELWADPVFYELCLLPLARSKDVVKAVPPKEQKAIPKGKKP